MKDTTDGTVTSYTAPGFKELLSITAGPDGALWFTGIHHTTGR